MNQEPCTLPAADLAPQTSAHLANGREVVDATGKLRILLLEDRAADAELVLRALQQEGFLFDVNRVWTEEDFLAQLRAFGSQGRATRASRGSLHLRLRHFW